MGRSCSTNGDKRNTYRHTIACTFSLPKFKSMLKRTRSDNSIKTKLPLHTTATKYIYRKKENKIPSKNFLITVLRKLA
jgi:hypothetical protein